MKVSVIVPCYNAEPYLNKCVDSIIGQSFHDIEIVLIDDCSSDNTSQICKGLCTSYPNIVFYRQTENMGVEAARNYGIQVSSGEWICFLDPDDWLDRQAIEVSLALAEKNDLDFTFSGYESIKNGAGKEVLATLETGIYSAKQIATLMVDHIPWVVMSCIGLKLYKKEFLEKNHIQFRKEYHYNEDGGFALEAFMKANKIGYISKCYYKYFQRANSSMHSYRKNAYDTIKNVDSLYEEYFRVFDCVSRESLLAVHNKRIKTIWSILLNEYDYNKDNTNTTIQIFCNDRDIRESVSYIMQYGEEPGIKMFCFLIKHRMRFLLLMMIKLKNKHK